VSDDPPIRDVYPSDSLGLWLFAVVFGGLSVLAISILPERAYRETPFMRVYVGLLAGSAVLFLVLGLRSAARRRKFGVVMCRFESLPLRAGEVCRGSVTTRLRELPAGGFEFRLDCERVTRGMRGSTHSTTIAEHEWRVDSQLVQQTTAESLIPFSTTLPPDMPATAEVDERTRIVWRMIVTAATRGVDFVAQFTVAVAAGSGKSTSSAVLAYVEARRAKLAKLMPTAASRVTFIAQRPAATEIEIVGNYRPVNLLIGSIVLLAMAGLIYAIYSMTSAIAVLIVGGLVWLLCAWGLVDAFFGVTMIRITEVDLTIDRVLFGWHMREFIDARAVSSVTTGMNGTLFQFGFFDVRVNMDGNRITRACGYLASRRDAEIVAARIERALAFPSAERSGTLTSTGDRL
jgi:hypothetical protein